MALFALQEHLDPQQAVQLQQGQLDVPIVQLEDFVMFQDELPHQVMVHALLATTALQAQKQIDQLRLGVLLVLGVHLKHQQQQFVELEHIKTKSVKMFA